MKPPPPPPPAPAQTTSSSDKQQEPAGCSGGPPSPQSSATNDDDFEVPPPPPFIPGTRAGDSDSDSDVVPPSPKKRKLDPLDTASEDNEYDEEYYRRRGESGAESIDEQEIERLVAKEMKAKEAKGRHIWTDAETEEVRQQYHMVMLKYNRSYKSVPGHLVRTMRQNRWPGKTDEQLRNKVRNLQRQLPKGKDVLTYKEK